MHEKACLREIYISVTTALTRDAVKIDCLTDLQIATVFYDKLQQLQSNTQTGLPSTPTKD